MSDKTSNILSAYTNITEKVYFVNIGAFDGKTNDPLYEHIIAGQWYGIMVEPVPEHFAMLQQNFADIEGITLEQCVIANQDGDVELWLPHDNSAQDTPDWLGQTSTLRQDQASRISKRITKNDNLYQPQLVSGISLESLLHKHEDMPLNVLKIDTEGYDYEILKTINFSRIRPAVIIYEQHVLSLREKIRALNLLQSHNYNIIGDGIDNLAVHKDVVADLRMQGITIPGKLSQTIAVWISIFRGTLKLRRRFHNLKRRLIAQ